MKLTGSKPFLPLILIILLLTGIHVTLAAQAGSDIIGTRITLPTQIIIGESVQVQDFIRNQGSETSAPFSIQYYLVPDPDTLDDRILIGTWDLPGLKAGAQRTGNTTIYIPAATQAGEYNLVRWIDPAGSLANENQQNNVQISGSPIQVTLGSRADITGIGTIIPAQAAAGVSIPVTVIVNRTASISPDPVSLSLYLSKTPAPDQQLQFLTTISLPPATTSGEQEIEDLIPISSELTTGPYYLFSSFVPELMMTGTGSPSTFWFNDEPLTISPSLAPATPSYDPVQPIIRPQEPDVVSLEVEIPDEAFIGDSFEITDVIRNVGGSEANIVRIEYQLSPDDRGTQGKHAGWWTLLSLKPDQTRSEKRTLGVPSGISPGLYHLTKTITVTSSVPELNTADNFWVSRLPIHIRYNPRDPIPDLTHIKTIWPQGQPGETVSITDTLTNIGTACATSVPVAYYLSPYQQFDPATAWYLGVWTVDSLCPMEQKTNSTIVTLPADLTNGEYYFYSVIDPCSFMDECGEGLPELEKSNNINSGRLYVGPCIFCN